MPTTRFPVTRDRLDRAGMVASSLCAVHCLLMPFVVGVLPVLGIRLTADEHIEWALVGVAAFLGSASLLPSYLRIHRKALPLVVFVSGVAALVITRLWIGDHHLEPGGMVAGGLLIACAHWLNRTHCRNCTRCQDERC